MRCAHSVPLSSAARVAPVGRRPSIVFGTQHHPLLQGVSAYQLLLFGGVAGAEGAVAEPVAEALPESMRHLFPRQSRAFCAGEYNAEVTLRRVFLRPFCALVKFSPHLHRSGCVQCPRLAQTQSVSCRECLFGVHFLPGVVRKDAAMVSGATRFRSSLWHSLCYCVGSF